MKLAVFIILMLAITCTVHAGKKESKECSIPVDKCTTDDGTVLNWGAEQIIKKVVTGTGISQLTFTAKINSIEHCDNWWKFKVDLDNGNGVTITGSYGVKKQNDGSWKLNGFDYNWKFSGEANAAVKAWKASHPNDDSCGDITVVNGCGTGGNIETEVEIPEEEEESNGCSAPVDKCTSADGTALNWGAEQIIKKVVTGTGISQLTFTAQVISVEHCGNRVKFKVKLDNGNGVTITGSYGVKQNQDGWKLNGFDYNWKFSGEVNAGVKAWKAAHPNDDSCGSITVVNSCGIVEEEEESPGGNTETEVEIPEEEEESKDCSIPVDKCTTDDGTVLNWGAEQIIKKVVTGTGISQLTFTAKVNSIEHCDNWWKFKVDLDNGNGVTITGSYGVKKQNDGSWKLNGFDYNWRFSGEVNAGVKAWKTAHPNDDSCGTITVVNSCGTVEEEEAEVVEEEYEEEEVIEEEYEEEKIIEECEEGEIIEEECEEEVVEEEVVEEECEEEKIPEEEVVEEECEEEVVDEECEEEKVVEEEEVVEEECEEEEEEEVAEEECEEEKIIEEECEEEVEEVVEEENVEEELTGSNKENEADIPIEEESAEEYEGDSGYGFEEGDSGHEFEEAVEEAY